MRRFSTALVIAASLACANSAMAAATWYIGNDQNSRGDSFAGPLASWPNSNTESGTWAAAIPPGEGLLSSNLQGLPTGTYTSGGVDLLFGSNISAVVTDSSLTVYDVSTSAGHYSTSDPGVDNYIGAYTNTLTFQFNTAISAFSFYVTDMGDAGSVTTMTLYDQGSAVGSYQVSCSADDSTNCVPVDADQNAAVSFIGVIDLTGQFDKVVFTDPGAADAVAIDDLTIGAPEPASVALLGCGLLSLAMVRRRSRR